MSNASEAPSLRVEPAVFQSLSSLPVHRRILPIRKGQYARRFMFGHGGRGLKFRRVYFDDRYTCQRQKLLRTWLFNQLPPHTFITGHEYDIKISENIDLDDSDVALFKVGPMPSWVNLDPQLVFWSEQLKTSWTNPEVREKYLLEKYGTRTHDQRAQKTAEQYNYAIESFIKYPHFPNTATFGFERLHIAKAVQKLMCMPDQASWRVGLFAVLPSHTFSIVVQMGKRSPPFTDDPPTCFIERILVLDTIVFDKFNLPMNYMKQNVAIAMTLNSVLPIPQNLFELVNRVWRPQSGQGQIWLQEHEKKGFCQHWNTYFLHQILVLNEDPDAMYNRLLLMSPQARQQLIVDFANDAASEALDMQAAGMTLPVQV